MKESILYALEKIVCSSSEPMLVLDANEEIVMVNTSACNLLGHMKEECLGRCCMEVLNQPFYLSSTKKAYGNDYSSNLFECNDRLFELNTLFDNCLDSGNTVRLCRLQDVTNSYQSKELEEYLKNKASMGVFKVLLDEYFTVLYATDNYYHIHGFTADEFKKEREGRAINCMFPEEVEFARKTLLDAYEKGVKDIVFEMRIIRRDGTVAWVLNQCSFRRMKEGLVLFGFITDNTIVKEQQESLKELERICEFTIANDYEVIYLFDISKREYKVVSVNEVHRKELLGKGTYADFYDLMVGSCVNEEDKKEARLYFSLEHVCECLEREPVYSFMTRIVKNDAITHIFVQARYYDEKKKSIIFCFRDVEEEEMKKEALRLALEAAKKANAAKSDFLARMSHDIRTPMNAIIGMTLVASLNIENKERVKDSLNKIDLSSRFLLSLINDILDMSKIESNKLQLSSAEFDFSEMINAITTITYNSAREKGVEFNVFTDPSLKQSYIGDTLRLKQIIMNLLSNALKFVPKETGKVSLKIESAHIKEKHEVIRFIVSDNGIGISKEFQKTIFNPFEQEARSQAGLTGSGLGLSITNNLVLLMNGSIRLKSEVGMGSVFEVEIPLMFSEKKSNINVLWSERAFGDTRFLIIDDDIIACEHIIALLKGMKVEVQYALSGREGVDLVKKEHDAGKDYDIVLVDWQMPDMDGVQTVREIRKYVGSEIVVVVMSAYDWSDIEKEAVDAGVNSFIGKPLFEKHFYELLQKVASSQSKMTPILNKEAAFNGQKILLAEDNDLNAEIVITLLENSNLSVIRAENGKVAVRYFEESLLGEFSAILMDVRMPLMDGLEATRNIRQMKREDASSIPIFALSANAFTEDVEISLEAGMNEHLNKPLDINLVYKCLRKYI